MTTRRRPLTAALAYEVEETDERVPDVAPIFRSRFRHREALRRAERLNGSRAWPYLYRWAVVRNGKHWEVVAFQNRAVPR